MKDAEPSGDFLQRARGIDLQLLGLDDAGDRRSKTGFVEPDFNHQGSSQASSQRASLASLRRRTPHHGTASRSAAPYAFWTQRAVEQRMAVARRRRELGWNWRVTNHGCFCGDNSTIDSRSSIDLPAMTRAEILELLAIAVVELVAMAMALADYVLSRTALGDANRL
jgi:alkylhydroperoxidase family enzyme